MKHRQIGDKVYNSIDDKVKIVEESYKMNLDFLEKEKKRIENERIQKDKA